MEKLKWYFKHGTKYELYSVLYKADKWILVQNDRTGKYSFGLERDFGTLFGFPVNQSCLIIDELMEILNDFIRIDTSYIESIGDIAIKNISRWKNMILVVENRTK